MRGRSALLLSAPRNTSSQPCNGVIGGARAHQIVAMPPQTCALLAADIRTRFSTIAAIIASRTSARSWGLGADGKLRIRGIAHGARELRHTDGVEREGSKHSKGPGTPRREARVR